MQSRAIKSKHKFSANDQQATCKTSAALQTSRNHVSKAKRQTTSIRQKRAKLSKDRRA